MTPEDEKCKFVTLREIDIRFAGIDTRFESTNEWRTTLESLQRGYMTKSENEVQHAQMVRWIDDINNRIAGTQQWIWIGIGIVCAAQFFVGIALILWHKNQ